MASAANFHFTIRQDQWFIYLTNSYDLRKLIEINLLKHILIKHETAKSFSDSFEK